VSPDRGDPVVERVVLVGFMGAGKTTVGRALAARLGWSFIDLDALIERMTGLDVPTLFRERGEAAFRISEREAAEEAVRTTRCVIAAGGGAFAEPLTREVLQGGGATVWLRCDPEALLSRVPLDGSRPLAANRERMLELLSERELLYRLADLTVDTTSAAPGEAAEEIARRLRLGEGQVNQG